MGPIAQSVEQRTFNPWVDGSSPSGPTVAQWNENPILYVFKFPVSVHDLKLVASYLNIGKSFNKTKYQRSFATKLSAEK